MRRLLIITFLFFAVSAYVSAQAKSFQLFYIAKDYSTNVAALCHWLQGRYEMARTDPGQCNVFYLANAESPIIIRQNLPDDNSVDFDKLMGALVTKSETRIYPQTDLPELIRIFSDYDVINDRGNKNYAYCELFFMITPTFWHLQYNEKIFAKLYYTMEFDSAWARGYIGINIYHNADDGLEVDENLPFGTLYPCENYDFQLLMY